MSDTTDTSDTVDKQHKAGLFDIRNIIGMLLTAYGVILTALGLFGDTGEDKTGGVNANLYAGIALLVVGVFFLAWMRLRPIVVPEDVDRDEVERPTH